jgi:MFS transporter, PPP family, 3-phenylpropionic acid transporter
MLQTSPFRWISQYYFGFFFVFGAYLPFWTLWLESKHITSSEIGMILGLGFTVRFVANLVITPRFGRAEQLIPALRVITFAGLAFLVMLWFGEGNFYVIAAGTILFNLCCGPIVPISDAVANYYAKLNVLDYGKARSCGSFAFIVASTIVGWCIAHMGSNMILNIAIVGMFGLMALSLRQVVPRPQSESAIRAPRVKLYAVLREKSVLLFIVLTSLIQGSHAAYYSFSSIYWKSVGYSEEVIGYLWSIGVIAEVLVFVISRRAFGKWRLHHMFLLASFAVIVRWGLIATSTNLATLVAVQALHSITFAVAHMAAIRYIQQAPTNKMVALQALYNAISLGGSVALLTSVSGWGYAHFGGQVFWVMAALGVLALFVRLPESPQEMQTS